MPSLRTMLISELNKISGLEKIVLQGKHDGFTCFNFNGKEVAHFDNDYELDVRLTKNVIKSEGLTHPADSINHPNRIKTQAHWIVLQIKQKKNINSIVRLVKLAITQL